MWNPDHRTDFESVAGPLPELIRRFADEYPGMRRRLVDADGTPLGYVNVCVDDVMVPRHQRDHTVVPAGSTVTFIAPMAGG
ncbi:MoaD/ThiS family protein [Actinoplanes sp. LDG1-06]|uniref:MoaD/ThiS family protein n=1 Tax=Paractinoplanes ovalisporus TaxID=2810368 RepID=A0ABS2AJR5_9ACTN|nr:MoaD/ThiS family protein [Actinoplanes ovalisporus]